jgi:ATP-dependent helicase YprA (DUF1998 family)
MKRKNSETDTKKEEKNKKLKTEKGSIKLNGSNQTQKVNTKKEEKTKKETTLRSKAKKTQNPNIKKETKKETKEEIKEEEIKEEKIKEEKIKEEKIKEEKIKEEKDEIIEEETIFSETKWKDLGCVSPKILKLLTEFEYLTKVQKESIPIMLENDLIVESQTGSGKTLAFIVPIVQKLLEIKNLPKDVPKCLIVCPTRELGKIINKKSGTNPKSIE